MLSHRKIDRICAVALAITLMLTVGYLGAGALGLISPASAAAYESSLFDASRVHTIDIVMDDWDGFIETCENEEYAACDLIIDGERYSNVAIRAKGNTSLSRVSSYGNDRYSFKVEFDHYDGGMTYHGLDKLSLNNLIQDATFMKDYIVYTLMGKMGVASPLCSYVFVTVNGEDWGIYLAAEGVEEAFIRRNYGADGGDMYKPDSMSFGAGRGNGQGFDMDAFRDEAGWEFASGAEAAKDPGGMPMEAGGDRAARGGAQGSADVMLQYIDDDPESYSNIFDNAVTDVSEADQERLINALRQLDEGAAAAVDVEQVIRYFAVHDFVRNDDSYTGSMIHNYYLYEENGVLSMVPWDYNLAFGGFAGGSASDQVNSPIDSPVSGGDMASRPMVAWIFDSEEYTERYHEVYAELIETVCESGWLDAEILRVSEMIAPYVERDLNAFFTYDEFTAGVDALRRFVDLRAESVAGQLAGEIPSTEAAQQADSAALVSADGLALSDMGSMGGMSGDMPGGSAGEDRSGMQGGMRSPDGMQMPEGMQMSEDTTTRVESTSDPDAGISDDSGGITENGEAARPGNDDRRAMPRGEGATVYGTEGAQGGREGLWLLVGSVALLLGGLLFAFMFRGRML